MAPSGAKRCIPVLEGGDQVEITLNIDGSNRPGGAPKLSVWDDVIGIVQSTVDFSHPSAAKHDEVYANVHRAFKVLKHRHSQWIAYVVALVLPRSPNLPAIGSCALCPRGLGNPAVGKLTDEMLVKLVQTLESSELCSANPALHLKEQYKLALKRERIAESRIKMEEKAAASALREAAKIQRQPQAKGKAASAAAAAKQVQTKKGGSRKQMALDDVDDHVLNEPIHTEQVAKSDFLEFLTSHLNYLLKIDDRQKEKVDAVRYMYLKAAMDEKVCIQFLPGKAVEIKNLTTTAKLMKEHFYRSGKLQPRPSDADFPRGTLDDEEALADPCEPDCVSDAHVMELLDSSRVEFREVIEHFKTNKLELPVPCHASASAAMNTCMMRMFTYIQEGGGVLTNRKDAWMKLQEAAVSEVVSVVPLKWDVALRRVEAVLDKVEALKRDVLVDRDTELKALAQLGVTAAKVRKTRIACIAHVLHVLGQQQVSIQEGPSVSKYAYAPSLVQSFLRQLVQNYDGGKVILITLAARS
jgi:hypothetical protein